MLKLSLMLFTKQNRMEQNKMEQNEMKKKDEKQQKAAGLKILTP